MYTNGNCREKYRSSTLYLPYISFSEMNRNFQYTCDCCGNLHYSWPSLTFKAPLNYDQLKQEDKELIAYLTSDSCIIHYPDQTDRFIRCVLIQKVVDHCEDLHYGLWVSLSDKSFEDYHTNFKNENHETQYFGWLSNNIPEYEFDKSIPTTIVTQLGNQRPEIIPHSDFDHPFVNDYYSGITKAEAEKRIKDMLEETAAKKIWWKFW